MKNIYCFLLYFIITLLINVNADLIYHHDADWMGYIDNSTKINEINIPGTHDTGTYSIGENFRLNYPEYSALTSYLPPIFKELTGQTQDLNITEQLESGIRYFDIRLGLNDKIKKLYVTHGPLACLEQNDNVDGDYLKEHNSYAYLYFEKVIEYCINFLRKHESETIIIHLKEEDINIKTNDDDDDDEVPTVIDVEISLLIKEIYNKFDKKENIYYKDYIYVPKEIDNSYTNDYIPTLKDVRGRIVFFSRSYLFYERNVPIGFLRDLDMKEGEQRKNCTCPLTGICNIKGNVCDPVEKNNFRYQDNYKLIADEKWIIVLKMLTEDSKFNKKRKDTHTINFMSIAINSNLLYSLIRTSGYTISEQAKTINSKLTEFLMTHTPPNEWFILDFPSPQSIRAIYKSNFRNENEYSGGIDMNELIKNSNNKVPNGGIPLTTYFSYLFSEVCEGVCEDIVRTVAEPLVEGVDYVVTKVGEGVEYIGDKIGEGLDYIGDKLEDGWNWLFGNDDDNDKGELRRRGFNENSNNKICLQRKIFIDNEGNKQDIVKLNYKCIDNNLNKWKIEPIFKDKSVIIISAYDGKCLNLSNKGLYVEECKKNDKYNKFIVKDNIICSQVDTTKCLDNIYGIQPMPKLPKKYRNLTCSTTFARLGIKCCDNQSAEVKYVDEIGNWGVENGKLCGIGYERCSFSALGFNCCSSVNPEVVSTDEYGSWGIEDGQWCGIGEAVYDTRIRIKNRKTKKL